MKLADLGFPIPAATGQSAQAALADPAFGKALGSAMQARNGQNRMIATPRAVSDQRLSHAALLATGTRQPIAIATIQAAKTAEMVPATEAAEKAPAAATVTATEPATPGSLPAILDTEAAPVVAPAANDGANLATPAKPANDDATPATPTDPVTADEVPDDQPAAAASMPTPLLAAATPVAAPTAPAAKGEIDLTATPGAVETQPEPTRPTGVVPHAGAAQPAPATRPTQAEAVQTVPEALPAQPGTTPAALLAQPATAQPGAAQTALPTGPARTDTALAQPRPAGRPARVATDPPPALAASAAPKGTAPGKATTELSATDQADDGTAASDVAAATTAPAQPAPTPDAPQPAVATADPRPAPGDVSASQPTAAAQADATPALQSLPPQLLAALAPAQTAAATTAPAASAPAPAPAGATSRRATAAARITTPTDAAPPAATAPLSRTAAAATAASATTAAIAQRAQGKDGAAPEQDARSAGFGDALAAATPQHGHAAAPEAAPARPAAPAPAPSQAAAPAQPQTANATAHEPQVTARPGQLGRELGVEIARAADAGGDTLRVRLNPAELGKIEVTLKIDDSRGIHATLRTESAAALDLLRRDSADLGRALDSAGFRADTQSFRFESRADQGGQGWSGGREQRPQGQSQPRGADLFAGQEPARPDYRPIRGASRVDLLA